MSMKKLTQAEFDAMQRDERGFLRISDNTDCTAVDFKGADEVVFGDYCVLGDYCTLGDYCKLGNRCELGNHCELGNGCTLGDYCKLGDYCTLGNGCTLGNHCELGDYCKLGNHCKLGNRCELGEGCRLGEYCDVRGAFEGGHVRNGLYITVGNIGSEHRTAYFYVDEGGRLFVRAGCWFSGMDEFKERVHAVHGGTLYEAQYMAACVYAETVLPLMIHDKEGA